jgi:hypothetical protein
VITTTTMPPAHQPSGEVGFRSGTTTIGSPTTLNAAHTAGRAPSRSAASFADRSASTTGFPSANAA